MSEALDRSFKEEEPRGNKPKKWGIPFGVMGRKAAERAQALARLYPDMFHRRTDSVLWVSSENEPEVFNKAYKWVADGTLPEGNQFEISEDLP